MGLRSRFAGGTRSGCRVLLFWAGEAFAGHEKRGWGVSLVVLAGQGGGVVVDQR